MQPELKMEGRGNGVNPLSSTYGTWVKWGWVLLFWIVSISLFSLLSSWNQNTAFEGLWRNAFKRINNNEVGQFHFIQYDPNCRPLYAMGFAHLKVSNGKAGIFHTALYKTIHIQDLYIRAYQNSDIKDPGKTNLSMPFSPPASATVSGDIHNYVKTLLEQKKHENKPYTWQTIDVSNAMEIRVGNFQYQMLNADNHIQFSLESKKASFSYSTDDIFLRGHVILTASDGRRLESNRVKWDVRKQLFRVEGMYVLQAREHRQRGRAVWVDEQLNIVSGEYVEKNQGKGEPWLAKL